MPVLSPSCPRLLQAGLLGLALAAAGPAAAGGDAIDCVPGGKASPADLVVACSTAIDNQAASPADRAAALVVRADARARISGDLADALTDLNRAIALDGKNASAYRLRGNLAREA